MLVVDDIPIIVGIIMFIPAMLFTIRAILDIKKLYYSNTNTANEHKTESNNESPSSEYKGYMSKYYNPTTQQTHNIPSPKQNDTWDDFND